MFVQNNALTEFESSGLRLRDFFIFHNTDTLKVVWSELCSDAACELSDADWLDVEYDFTTLFVGPGKLTAAPYASVYLEEDALVMGKTTLTLREFIENLGLSIDNDNNIPGDHVSYILELVVLLQVNSRQTPEYRTALTQFIAEYVAIWLPAFIERIKSNAQTATLRRAADKLSNWLDELKRDYHYEH